MTGPIDRRRLEDPEPAHLGDAAGGRQPVHRWSRPPELADLVRRYWLPVWSLPPGETSVQRVLMYPCCQLVIGPDYARVFGVSSGLSTQELSGSGWVAGAMLQPATGSMLLGGSMSITDGSVDLVDLDLPFDATLLTAEVRDSMSGDPGAEASQREAVRALEAAIGRLGPVDEEGLLVNAIVEHVEGDPTVQRVGQICEKFDLGERALQRLTARRIGLSPKWLIQRRRLQEAAAGLVDSEVDLARLADELGYADQAHFTRDWRRVTGMTPGEYAASAS